MKWAELVTVWENERLMLAEVQPYTASKSARNAMMFDPYFPAPVEAINPLDITSALGQLAEGRSSTTLRKYYVAANSCFNWAIDRELLECRNPFRKVPKPKEQRTEKHSLSVQEAAKLNNLLVQEFRVTKDAKYRSLVLAAYIALNTGMRRGEILALTYNDVENAIDITKAIKGDGSLGEPKSSRSIRKVHIDNTVSALISKQQMLNSASGNDMIFANINGNYLEHHWRKFCKDNGLDVLFHELRHTHATLMVLNGVDIKTVQQRLGHSDIQTTMNYYVHSNEQADIAAQRTFADLMAVEETTNA